MEIVGDKSTDSNPTRIGSEGLSGWTENDLKDLKSTGFLQSFLASDPEMRFLPALTSMDKTPNLDVSVTVGQANAARTRSVPLFMVHVQVKTLPANYENNNVKGMKSR